MNSFAKMLGMPISAETTCFIGSFPDGIAVIVNGKEYFLRFTDFPWFEYCNVAELRDVTSDRCISMSALMISSASSRKKTGKQ